MGRVHGPRQGGIVGTRAPHQDIVAQRFIKQRGILRHGRKLVAQHAEVEILHRDAANRDLATVGIHHPGQQVECGRFSRARRPHKRRGPARLGGEVQALQDGLVVIGQPDILEADRGLGGRLEARARPDSRLDVEHLVNPLQAGRGRLPGACQPAQPPHGLKGKRKRGEKGHEIADAAFARHHLAPAQGQNGDKAQARDNIGQGGDDAAHRGDLDLGLADAGDDVSETADLVVLGPVQLD